MNSGARTAAVPPEATAPTETDAQAESIAHQRMARRRNLPRRKKPQLLLETAYEQRRADGGRAAGSHRTDRNRRAGGEHRSTREWRAGGTCRARRSPCPYRERRMNRGAWADVAVRME